MTLFKGNEQSGEAKEMKERNGKNEGEKAKHQTGETQEQQEMESQNRIKQKFKIKSECIESRDN
jgi:uncharacterized protein YeaC (DUF1315 family)